MNTSIIKKVLVTALIAIVAVALWNRFAPRQAQAALSGAAS